MNPEKLAKLQAQGRSGSKGTPRRVVKKVHRAVAQDDRKLQGALEKLALTNMAYVEEVNMFKEDSTILHFRAPKGKSSIVQEPKESIGDGRNEGDLGYYDQTSRNTGNRPLMSRFFL